MECLALVRGRLEALYGAVRAWRVSAGNHQWRGAAVQVRPRGGLRSKHLGLPQVRQYAPAMDRAPETDQAGGGRERVRSVWRVLIAAWLTRRVTLAADLGGVAPLCRLILAVTAVRTIVDGPHQLTALLRHAGALLAFQTHRPGLLGLAPPVDSGKDNLALVHSPNRISIQSPEICYKRRIRPARWRTSNPGVFDLLKAPVFIQAA